jgi:hypothetical protein
MASRKLLKPKPTKNGRVAVPKRPKNLKKPLGWLPVPPAVEKMVRESMSGRASEKEVREQINYDTLRFYYGGDIVLVRTDLADERGVEVLAVGEGVLAAVQQLSPEGRQVYGTACPIPWDTIVL